MTPGFEEGDHQVVLRGKVSIESGLGHAGLLDDLVYADIADTATGEQLVNGLEDATPRWRRGDGVNGTRHGVRA
jgi:uncharacterized FAD-dependent dehydrogenase